ncbi:ELKS/Rab6-interacting/CAST family member 1-like [Eriocheir sinensis]|uniref:ELKS/Rab6-interacting/CAST family member 1-like n=1 Tax=Eriocheir sinensis TaxID=95602 RepID=UPI0021C91BCD|nr:ELKS/Rab6-interacting/CAST family member 1-like [Eriocheir sinensis]XP_050728662.1 ELKS/Rab6-interacting/CAST family member 1-like [Eriocheir sinensis]XP_050728663.1 ELKS/Rab6-interacting/CAST family member 1-like [Eriocheir sinensis]XP_050728664.1 ELKS/Rab6-interacting/CAST family member 1-like [Eriocheir sinensis]
MDKDTLLQDYEDTVQKQAVLLTRQQATIDGLQEEVAAQQHRAEVTGKQLQARLESLQQQAKAANLQDASEEVHLLKQELETALKEKEASQAESRRQGLEVQRLHQALLASKGSNLPHKESEEYMKAVEALEEETMRLRTQAAEAEEEKVVILKLNNDLKKELASLASQVEQEHQAAQALRSLMEEKESSTQELNRSFNALNKKFLEQSEDLQLLLAQIQSLKGNRDQLAKILLTVKEKMKEAQCRVAESMRIAEDSLVEKDAALLREKHALNEVHRLEGTVASLTEEAGRRAQAEVSKVKDDYNNNIKKMSQELARLEIALGEKKLECDKGQRELKKVMEVMEQLQEEVDQKKEQHRHETLNLYQRINSLETQVTSLKDEKSSMSSLGLQSVKEVEQQRKDLLGRIAELEERLSIARNESARAKLDSVEARSNLAKVTNQLEKLQKESIKDHKFLKKQLRLKMEELEELSSGVEGRLETSENTHREALTQCYHNTAVMQDNCSRLQTQLREQKKEYGQRISELNQQLEDAQAQQQHTALALHKASTSLAVSESLVAQYKARVAEVEERLLTAERRFYKVQHQNEQDRETLRTS